MEREKKRRGLEEGGEGAGLMMVFFCWVELRVESLSWESDEMSVDNKNLGLGLGYVVELLNQ